MSYKEKNFNDIASNSILPAGVYNITIKDAKDKTALDGMSEYVSITAVTSEGNHIFANHMTECNSEKAVTIGLQRLKELAEPIGAKSFDNFPDALIGKKVRAKVGVTSDLNYGTQNRIDRYYPLTSSDGEKSSDTSSSNEVMEDIPF